MSAPATVESTASAESTTSVSAEKRTSKSSRVFIFLAVLFSLMAIAWFLVLSPAFAKRADDARHAHSVNNLQQIGTKLMMYESEPGHDGYPADLSAVDFPDPRTLINPRFPQLTPGYVYVPAKSSRDGEKIVVYENVPEDQTALGRYVLTAEGRVFWMGGELFAKNLEENLKQQEDQPDVQMPKSMWDNLDLGSSKAGDFVEYDLPILNGRERREVKAVGNHTMTVEFTIFDGEQTKKSSSKIAYNTADKVDQFGFELKSTQESVEIPRGKYEATRYDLYQNGRLTAYHWCSKEIPVTGMIKSTTAEGKVASILTNYGRAKK